MRNRCAAQSSGAPGSGAPKADTLVRRLGQRQDWLQPGPLSQRHASQRDDCCRHEHSKTGEKSSGWIVCEQQGRSGKQANCRDGHTACDHPDEPPRTRLDRHGRHQRCQDQFALLGGDQIVFRSPEEPGTWRTIDEPASRRFERRGNGQLSKLVAPASLLRKGCIGVEILVHHATIRPIWSTTSVRQRKRRQTGDWF